MKEIISITEKVPQEVKLPDGEYLGTWGGYVIDLHLDGKQYQLSTREGVKGIGIKVVVTVKDGKASFKILNN